MACQSDLTRWERFLDSFSTSGGHLLIGFLMLLFGCVMEKLRLSYGHEVQVLGVGAIALVMKTEGSNQRRKERLIADPLSSPTNLPDSTLAKD